MPEEQETDQEPSIEEILDSIRQIISEDDDEAVDMVEPEEDAKPEVVAESAPLESPLEAEAEPKSEEVPISEDDLEAIMNAEPEPEEDIIDLTDKVEEEPVEIDMTEAVEESALLEPEPEEKVTPEPEPKSEPIEVDMTESKITEEDSLLTNAAKTAAYEAFSELAHKAEIERQGQITVEDVVREEIRPLLKTWIDRHLPEMVERLLQEELEKVSRRVLGDS